MPLNVGFRWCSAKARDVLRDKRQVVELPLAGLRGTVFGRRAARMPDRGNQLLRTHFDQQSDAIGKLNAQALLSLRADLQDLLALQRLRECFVDKGLAWHGDSVFVGPAVPG